MTNSIFNSDTTILTPNRRLAASLQKHYQQYMRQHHDCWQTPDILPLSSWLQRVWQACEFQENAPYLLNSTQEQYLWEQILATSKENSFLLQINETATLVKSAHSLLKQWCLDTSLPAFQASEDYLALHRWSEAFTYQCTKNHWIDTASLPSIIAEHIALGTIKLPKRLALIGFTEISPQIKQLLSLCESTGCEVEYSVNSKPLVEFNQAHIPPRQEYLAIKTDDEEIILAARWAKAMFLHNQDAMIGCVFPNLDKIRDRVSQLYGEIFAELPGAYNISAGKRLSDFPIIHAAIQLLSLSKKNISRELISYLLASPFMGGAEAERLKRANADRMLRQHNITQLNIEESHPSLSYCNKFTASIKKFLKKINEYNDKANYEAWAKRISDLLSTLGWPGERSLNSEEYQTVEAWHQVLNELATLDYVAKPVDLTGALQALKQIAASHIFQPKTPDARIQVLGILEAAASPYDYLWVAGMDDLSWPPQPKPNPFIPKQLQREYNMPHATAERELMFCTAITQQFKENSSQIIFSYAVENEEMERLASPLIKNLPETTIDNLALEAFTPAYQSIFESKQLEIFIDNQAPSLSEGETIQGGMSIIKKQAMCAFKAFAEQRLYAQGMENPLLGLRKKDRGELLHKVMEIIWNKLETQETLLKLDNQALSKIITDSIDGTFQLIPTAHANYRNYINLEKQRIYKLVDQWLRIEKSRPPFKIFTNEKKSTVTLNKLTLTVRVDRIDELSNGKKLIIDYKSGKDNDTNSWLGDRPDEPQLPLYALLEPESTAAIAFAQLYPGKYLFSGFSHADIEIKGVKPLTEWSKQLDAWRTVLNKLSDDFYLGEASVNPKEQEKTCEWCELKPLCRINDDSVQAR